MEETWKDEETGRKDFWKKNPKVMKRGISGLSVFLLIVRLFVLISLLVVLETRFERIVVCLLAMIIFQQASEANLKDLEQDKEQVPTNTAFVSIAAAGVPMIVAILALLYFIFFK